MSHSTPTHAHTHTFAHEPNARNIGYCRGFTDGYAVGEFNNPYDNLTEPKEVYNNIQYNVGYDAGVAQYCKEIDNEDEDFT
jgi:hypothetical protein